MGAWLDFFLEGVEQTATGAVDTAHRLFELFARDREQVEGLGRRAGSALRVFDTLRRCPSPPSPTWPRAPVPATRPSPPPWSRSKASGSCGRSAAADASGSSPTRRTSTSSTKGWSRCEEETEPSPTMGASKRIARPPMRGGPLAVNVFELRRSGSYQRELRRFGRFVIPSHTVAVGVNPFLKPGDQSRVRACADRGARGTRPRLRALRVANLVLLQYPRVEDERL